MPKRKLLSPRSSSLCLRRRQSQPRHFDVLPLNASKYIVVVDDDVDIARFQAMMAAGQPPDIWRTQGPLVPQVDGPLLRRVGAKDGPRRLRPAPRR